MTNIVFLAVLVAVATAEARLVSAKKPMEMKPVIGGFLAGIFLLTFAAVNERLAKMFCLLIILAALVVPIKGRDGKTVAGGTDFIKALTPKK